MTDPLSLYALVVNATWPVLAIMALLLLASLVSWTMIIQRYVALSNARRDLLDFEDFFWSGTDLRALYEELNERELSDLSGIERIFYAGFQEFERIMEMGDQADPDAVLGSVQRASKVAVSREEESLEVHLGFLASVGSVSPYVGLFGTVIGIINAFRSLANVTQATIASVAPGISEALLATAMGLFAAIPAVIAFNRYSARVETLSKRYEDFSDELVSILFRAAHREQT